VTELGPDTGASLSAVRDAALEYALVADGDARRYFALAGVLDRVQSRSFGSKRNPRSDIDAGEPPDAEPDPEADATSDSGRDGEVDSKADTLLPALLSCTLAVAALDADAGGNQPGTFATPWTPGGHRTDFPAGGHRTDLVAAGAVAACRRFDVDVETVAARAGLPVSDLRTRIAETE
jgi:hypothetical protein